MEVRAATVDDAPGIAAVHVAAWQWAYAGLLPDSMLDRLSVGPRAETWRSIMGNPELDEPFVALVDGRVIGFVHQGASRDADASPSTGEVTAIYLDPDHVGTGAGSALWRRALARLSESGFTGVTVWVLDTNERGRRFYERMGFTPDGAQKEEDRGSFTSREVRYRGVVA